MDDENAIVKMDPETNAALTSLADAVAKVMLETVQAQALSSRGVMWAATIGIKAFSMAAMQVEGWSEVQRDNYLADAMVEGMQFNVQALLVGATQH
jgi:hypothetical protein